MDGDGADELLCGSGDGQFYCYELLDNDQRFTVDTPVMLTDGTGANLTVSGGHSAPAIADVDGDGTPDVITGAGDGKVYWLRGLGSLSFEAPQLLLDPGMG